MTDSAAATVARVPEPREIADQDAQAILDALAAREKAQEDVEKAVARALKNHASIRAVQQATGLSPNTIGKYGAKYGWPTEENRKHMNATRAWTRSRQRP